MASEAEKTENGGEDAGAKVHLREEPGNLPRPKVPRMARAIRPRNDHPNGSEDAHKKGYLIPKHQRSKKKEDSYATHTRRYARCSKTTLKPKTVVFTTEVMVFRLAAMRQQDESAHE